MRGGSAQLLPLSEGEVPRNQQPKAERIRKLERRFTGAPEPLILMRWVCVEGKCQGMETVDSKEIAASFFFTSKIQAAKDLHRVVNRGIQVVANVGNRTTIVLHAYTIQAAHASFQCPFKPPNPEAPTHEVLSQ